MDILARKKHAAEVIKKLAKKRGPDMAAEPVKLDDQAYSWNDFQKAVKGKKFFDPKTFEPVLFAKLDESIKKRIWGKWNAQYPMSEEQLLEGRREKGIRASLLERAAENAFQNRDILLANALYTEVEKVALVLPLKRVVDTLETLAKTVKPGAAALKTVGPAYSMVREHIEGEPNNKDVLDPVLKALGDMRGLKPETRKKGHEALVKALKAAKKKA